jgi:hypothetical protein
MRVCKEDLDQFDPWRLPAIQTENIALRFPRPDVSLATGRNLLDTQGAPNTFVQYDNIFLEGNYGEAGGPGNLDLAGGYSPATATLEPTIYRVIPSSGTKNGGTLVSIIGSGFTGVTTVRFGSEIATFSIVNSTQIAATSPAYPVTGLVDVSVASTYGTATSHGAFNYT